MVDFKKALADSKVKERARDVMVEELGVELGKLTDDAHFMNDLGADSLDTIELIIGLEKEFDIDIYDEDAEKISTVGEAVKYLQGRMSDNG